MVKAIERKEFGSKSAIADIDAVRWQLEAEIMSFPAFGLRVSAPGDL